MAVLRRALAVSRTATFVVLAGWGIVIGSALYLSRTARIDMLLGNYVTRQGTVGVLAGRRPDLLPDAAWTALIVASLYATLMLALVVVTRLPAARRAARAFRDGFTVDRANTAGLVLGGFALLYLAALELALGFTQVVPTGHVAPAFSQTPYDRYLIPLVPIVVVLAWSDPSLFWSVPRVAASSPRRGSGSSPSSASRSSSNPPPTTALAGPRRPRSHGPASLRRRSTAAPNGSAFTPGPPRSVIAGRVRRRGPPCSATCAPAISSPSSRTTPATERPARSPRSTTGDGTRHRRRSACIGSRPAVWFLTPP